TLLERALEFAASRGMLSWTPRDRMRMMMHRATFLFITAVALAATPAAAQETPYVQQDVAYRIEARLDDAAEVLSGRARMRYVNRSPATLDSLYFHLYLNAFRPNSAWARRELEFGNTRFQALGPDARGL